MIERLRRRFVLVAMAAVTVVIFLVCAGIDVVALVGCERGADAVLELIADNGGRIPPGPGPLGPEGAFSTRYFTVSVDGSGVQVSADLSHVAAVTDDGLDAYVALAVDAAPGFGWFRGYRYLVVDDGAGGRGAVFLDRSAQLASVGATAATSLLVGLVADVLVYVLVRLFSKRAIDPLVQSARRQQRFVTDASHELKTPLTVIVTSLRLLEMEVGENRWIEKAERQAASLARLIDELIVLSRLEGDGGRPRGPVDVSAVVTEVADGLAAVAEAEGHPLEVRVEPGLEVWGDGFALRALVSTLLDNAVKYALPEGTVGVSLSAARRGVELRVTNPCEPLDDADLDRLFDRFFRPDTARSRETGGFGIGLAQAKGVVESHGGTIGATQREEAVGGPCVFQVTAWVPARPL